MVELLIKWLSALYSLLFTFYFLFLFTKLHKIGITAAIRDANLSKRVFL